MFLVYTKGEKTIS